MEQMHDNWLFVWHSETNVPEAEAALKIENFAIGGEFPTMQKTEINYWTGCFHQYIFVSTEQFSINHHVQVA